MSVAALNECGAGVWIFGSISAVSVLTLVVLLVMHFFGKVFYTACSMVRLKRV